MNKLRNSLMTSVLLAGMSLPAIAAEPADTVETAKPLEQGMPVPTTVTPTPAELPVLRLGNPSSDSAARSPDSALDQAEADYQAALDKAKADFKAASENCRQQPENTRAACMKAAAAAENKAAADAKTTRDNATAGAGAAMRKGRTEPSKPKT